MGVMELGVKILEPDDLVLIPNSRSAIFETLGKSLNFCLSALFQLLPFSKVVVVTIPNSTQAIELLAIKLNNQQLEQY